MTDSNKIFIISASLEKTYPLIEELTRMSDDLQVASTFTTDSDCSSSSAEAYQYYISNDQLDLDYKNNALLYVTSDTVLQTSTGIAIDTYYNSDIIPASIKAFNSIKEKFYEDSLIVWLDYPLGSKTMSVREYRLQMIEFKYFMNQYQNIKDHILYFNQNEKIEDVAKVILEYIEADDDRKKELIEENS